jgi:hypothetical protein
MSIETDAYQVPQSGKVILMRRECSSMVSPRSEYLCIERAGPRRFSLSICSYEVLGPVYDLSPEVDLFDQNGQMIVPELLNGQAVSLEDGEYLVGKTLLEIAGHDPVTIGAADLDVGLIFCTQSGWTRERHFMRVWRRIQGMVRMDGTVPMSRFKPWPASHQSLLDDLVDQASGRRKRRRGFKRLGAWVEGNDWDALVDDGPGGGWVGLALDLQWPSGHLSDADLVDYEGRASRRGLADVDRIRYARVRLAESLRAADDGTPSVHVCPVRHTDGTGALLCGVARIRGQAGPELEWHGVFDSLGEYLDGLPSRSLVHEDDLADLTDAQILAAWHRS